MQCQPGYSLADGVCTLVSGSLTTGCVVGHRAAAAVSIMLYSQLNFNDAVLVHAVRHSHDAPHSVLSL